MRSAVSRILSFVLFPMASMEPKRRRDSHRRLHVGIFSFFAAIAERVTGITLVYVKDVLILLLVTLASALFSLHFLPLGLAKALTTWLVVMTGFVVAAGYSVTECKSILHHFLPSRLGAR